MRELTFKVSAKAARLFGRENASNAEAAISELVKNAYDADATRCLICILATYPSTPSSLSRSEYDYLRVRDSSVEKQYEKDGGKDRVGFRLRSSDPARVECAYMATRHLRDLWIVDDGTGMSAETIERCWMVIGTNDKEKNVISRKGRARTGAKGIGRFALDRLGADGTVYSTSGAPNAVSSIRWHVDWNRFDQVGSILDEIPAELDEDGKVLAKVLAPLRRLPRVGDVIKEPPGTDWTTGTAIRIGQLRDDWSREQVDQLNKTLGALVPPVKQRELRLYLFDDSNPEAYGPVDPILLDDFDYKLEASVDRTNSVKFELYRNELNPAEIDPELFDLPEMREHPLYSFTG